MKVLIIGGFGYLGGRLAQFLWSQNDYEVILGTREHTTYPDWLPQAKVVQIKWDSQAALENVCTDVDVVIHLAAMNAQECANDPSSALEFNGVSTAKLLHIAIQQGVKKFIYLSTAHVYSAPLTGTITEETCPVNLHPYATSHRAAEDVVRFAYQQAEIEGTVIRLSNAFGAAAHIYANCWMLLVNDLCLQAVKEKRLLLKTAGLQRRDFVTINNVTRAIVHIIHLLKEQAGNGVFNVGGQWAPRIIDIAELVQKRCKVVYGFEPEIIRPEPDPNEIGLSLDYRIDKLIATGFSLIADTKNEIDATLKLCQEFK